MIPAPTPADLERDELREKLREARWQAVRDARDNLTVVRDLARRCDVAEARVKELEAAASFPVTVAAGSTVTATWDGTAWKILSVERLSKDLPPQPGDEKPVDPESGNGVTWGDLLGRGETP